MRPLIDQAGVSLSDKYDKESKPEPTDDARPADAPPTNDARPMRLKPQSFHHGAYKPEGAVRMNSYEVIKMQRGLLKNWKPQSDIWPFKFAPMITSAVAALSGYFIHNHFRHKFYLRNYAFYKTYFPCVLFPAITAVATQMYIQKRVMMMSDCPSCIGIRAGTAQLVSGVGYSLTLAPVLCISTSKHYHTYVLTKYTFQPNLKHALKTKPSNVYALLTLIVVNFAVGYLVAHLQGRTLETLTIKDAKKTAERLMSM